MIGRMLVLWTFFMYGEHGKYEFYGELVLF